MKILLIFIFCFSISFSNEKPSSINLKELIKKIETQYSGNSSHALIEMKIVKSSWKRTLVLDTFSKGRDKFLARITKPRKDKGTTTLKIKNKMWNYLPKIDRVIKTPSSLMGDSWMGSHFTNDDLIKVDKIDALYDLSLIKKEDKNFIFIEAIPKENTAVVWGKIIYKVSKKNLIISSSKYYDEDDELIRIMSFSKVKKIKNKEIPMMIKIKPIDEEGEYTEITYKKLEFDIPIKKSLFSTRSLKKRR